MPWARFQTRVIPFTRGRSHQSTGDPGGARAAVLPLGVADDAAAVLERFDRLVRTDIAQDEDLPGIRLRLRHSVTEMVRSERIARLLGAPDTDWDRVGRTLTEGHLSMRDDCRVTVPELDLAVTAGLAAGAVGAKVVGGGFGGSVLALVPTGRADSVAGAVGEAFAEAGFRPPLFLGLEPSDAAYRVL